MYFIHNNGELFLLLEILKQMSMELFVCITSVWYFKMIYNLIKLTIMENYYSQSAWKLNVLLQPPF